MPDTRLATYFQLFSEIGKLSQLSRALLEARLEHGLLLPHFSVLNHLVQVAEGTTPLRLANAFQVPKASMTHTLAGLVKAGYIQMQENEKDKRSKLVFITEAGRKYREKAIASLTPDFDEVAELFSEKDAQALVPALQQLREVLDRQRD